MRIQGLQHFTISDIRNLTIGCAMLQEAPLLTTLKFRLLRRGKSYENDLGETKPLRCVDGSDGWLA